MTPTPRGYAELRYEYDRLCSDHAVLKEQYERLNSQFDMLAVYGIKSICDAIIDNHGNR